MHIFKDCQIVLDLTTSVGFKKKQELRKKITENGGVISYIVTKKSTHVVCNDAEKAGLSYKCKMAAKYSIPVVSLDFIHDSFDRGELLNTDDYLVGSKNKSEKLSSGTIAVTKSQNVRKQVKSSLDPCRLPVWGDQDKNRPMFSEYKFEVAKYAILKKVDKSGKVMFVVLEIHVYDDDCLDKNSEDSYKYRVSSHYGNLSDLNKKKLGTTEFIFIHTSDEALCVYSYLYQQQIQKKYKVTYDRISPRIGSLKLCEMIKRYGSDQPDLSTPVSELVDVIWREAAGELENIISVPLQDIKIEQVEEAEAILLCIKGQSSDIKACSMLMADFYKAIPHRPEFLDFNYSKLWLSKKQDVCQLIKDMVSVSEANSWLTRGSTESKYKSLRCHIEHIDPDSWEYEYVTDLVLSSLKGDTNLKIENMYSVQRFVEDDNFRSDLDPKEMLFHSSKVENFVGILSRGLMLPKVVVDDLGGTRTDAGMLGNGIYFARSASTSAKYSKASVTKGTRLMVISQVALGKCMDFYKYDTTLEAPPGGYDSTHGVATTSDLPSEFKDDEYVIYNTNQQRLKFLVEFTIDDDEICPYSLQPEFITESFEDEIMEKNVIDLKDVQNVQDPLSKVIPGLVSIDNSLVELKEIHIRGRLMDLAGEVVVIQEYRNQSNSPIEAKYVFPLDDLAAVCGFEAFINGKHVVGEVKEKETAHKEYKKAISEGHGAYLMDQDEETPDVFTVSVGNLPPGAFVLIKITYVTELQVEGEKISFNVPGSVAPWKQKFSSATEVKDKTWETHQVEMGRCTVEVAIEMPFDIREIECTSHKIRMKKTASKAVIAMVDGQTIEDGFHLLVSLAEIHVPRMWVESYDGDTDNQACMLTFYPEFEAEEDSSIEVVMLLDLSNSMKGSTLTEAKKIILLTLQHLPTSATFNMVAFGTTYKELFPASCSKNKSNMKLAEGFLESCQANMGNTELYRPLHSFFLLKPESAVKSMYHTSEGSYRNIFLISDGHVNNEEATLEQVYKNSQHTRIFTFGVSSVANRHLLRALARVGAGAYEYFDSKSKSKWENKVKSQISKASQPGLTSVSVAWQQYDNKLPPPIQAPSQITALFSGTRQVIYGFVPNCLMATLYAEIAGQQISTVVSTSDLSVTQGKILHRLTAKAVIRDWEEGVLSPDRTDHHVKKMNMKKDIIDLSKKYSIVTKLTSFVAIEKREEGKTDEMDMSETEFKHEFIDGKESVDILSYMQYEDELQDQDDSDVSTSYSASSHSDDMTGDELIYCACEESFEYDGPVYEHDSSSEESVGEYVEEEEGTKSKTRLLDSSSEESSGEYEEEEEGTKSKTRLLVSKDEEDEESSDEDMAFCFNEDIEPRTLIAKQESPKLEERSRSSVLDLPVHKDMLAEVGTSNLEMYMALEKDQSPKMKRKKKVLADAENDLSEVNILLKSSIEKVLDRSEKLNELEEKSSKLCAAEFSSFSRALKSVSAIPRIAEQQQQIMAMAMTETTAFSRDTPLMPMLQQSSGPPSPPAAGPPLPGSPPPAGPPPPQSLGSPLCPSGYSPPPLPCALRKLSGPLPPIVAPSLAGQPPQIFGKPSGPPPPPHPPPTPGQPLPIFRKYSGPPPPPGPPPSAGPPLQTFGKPSPQSQSCKSSWPDKARYLSPGADFAMVREGPPPLSEAPQMAKTSPMISPPPQPLSMKSGKRHSLNLLGLMSSSSSLKASSRKDDIYDTLEVEEAGCGDISEAISGNISDNDELEELEEELNDLLKETTDTQTLQRKDDICDTLEVEEAGCGDISEAISGNISDNDELEELEEELNDLLKETTDTQTLQSSSQMISRKTHGGIQQSEEEVVGFENKFAKLGRLRAAKPVSSPPKSGFVSRASLLSDIQKTAEVRKSREKGFGGKFSAPPVSWRTCGSSIDNIFPEDDKSKPDKEKLKPVEPYPGDVYSAMSKPNRKRARSIERYNADDKAEMEGLILQSGETDEDVSIDWNRKVEDYGIGVEIPSILCGKSNLTIQSIASLLNMQKSDGHWEFSNEFDKLLNINSQICIDVLEKAGIKSLGKSIYVEILSLLATVITVYSVIYILCPEFFPMKKRYYLHESHLENVIQNARNKLNKAKYAVNFGDKDPVLEIGKALEFCFQKTLLHPWVPDMLELGPDWFYVVGRMMPGFVEVS